MVIMKEYLLKSIIKNKAKGVQVNYKVQRKPLKMCTPPRLEGKAQHKGLKAVRKTGKP